jgi:hypothetical protein
MRPHVIAAVSALHWWLRVTGVSIQPSLDVVTKELLAPDHPGKRLALHLPFILTGEVALQFGIELISFSATRLEYCVEGLKGRILGIARKSNPDAFLTAGGHRQDEVSGAPSPCPFGVYRGGMPVHDVFMEGVLRMAAHC